MRSIIILLYIYIRMYDNTNTPSMLKRSEKLRHEEENRIIVRYDKWEIMRRFVKPQGDTHKTPHDVTLGSVFQVPVRIRCKAFSCTVAANIQNNGMITVITIRKKCPFPSISYLLFDKQQSTWSVSSLYASSYASLPLI